MVPLSKVFSRLELMQLGLYMDPKVSKALNLFVRDVVFKSYSEDQIVHAIQGPILPKVAD